MAQRPRFMQTMQSGVNPFHHDHTMDDLSDSIHFLSLLNRAQLERNRLEWTKVMLSRIQNGAPNRYLLAPHTGPVQHNNMGIRPYQLPVWPCILERRQGTGVYIPNYNRGSCKNYGNGQQKQQMQPTKASGEKEKNHMGPCHTSYELALPKEWTY